MSTPSPALDRDVTRQAGRPAMVQVTASDPVGWSAAHRDAVRAAVAEHGAILVRGLGLRDVAQVADVFAELAPGGLLPDREGFASRESHPGGVYSSLAWPANQPMCMHHELSYTERPPGLLLLACLRAAADGGATGVADAAAVLDALPADLVDRFDREGWVLARSFNGEIGASWQEAFGSDDRAAVEDYCRTHGIELEWQPDGGLRTRQRRPAVVRHPVSGRRCWFNQVAFLNEWTMAPEVHEYLVDVYGVDGLPFNTLFGNGDPIGEDVVALLNDVYEAQTLREPWQPGDLMLVDNVATAHSREAYLGQREVLVGMAEPVGTAELAGPGRGGPR